MKNFYFILFLLFINNIWGQTTIISENMGSPSGTTAISSNVFQNSSPIVFTGTADCRTSTASSGYSGASGSGNIFITNSIGTFFQIAGINTLCYSNLSLSLGHYKSTTASNNELIIEVSSDGTNYTPLTYSRATGSGTAVWTLIAPTGTIPSTSNLRIRFRQTSSTPQFRIDDVKLTGSLAPSTSLLELGGSPNSPICNGSSGNLKVTITGGTSPYTVVYSNGSNQTVNSYTSGSNISVSPTSNTTYSLVSVTDANSCTSTGLSGTPTITVNPKPSASVLSSTSAVFCSGGSSSNLQVNITGGTSPYTVVYNDGANQTVNNYSSASNISVSPTATTSYSLVSVTDANGCTSTGLSGTPTISLVSASTNATLAASSTTSNTVEQCTDGSGWTYYATSGAPTQLLFGIKKGGNTFNASVDITAGATISKTSSNGVNQENGMFLMGRYWDVTLNSGTITTPVDIRFFYDPNELAAAKTARDAAFAALPGTTLAVTNGNTAEWFKSINSAFNTSYINSILGNKFPGSIQKFSSPSTGTLNGVDYVELTGITSFSGGTGGFSFGTNGSSGNSLPVTWAGFDVKSTEMGNKLTWETASEKNTSHFEVEYSYDGINFNPTATHIPAAGNSQNLNTYTFTHSDFSSYIYYRIKQIDNDARYDYSVTKMIKRTNDKTFNVSFYPLPVSDNNEVNLNITSIDKSEIRLRIMNMTGQEVFSKSIFPTSDYVSEKINISNLISGIYQLEVMNSQGKRMIKFSK